MNSRNEEYDDLTRIKFIGPVWQQWFRDRMEVHTYRDLATLSVDKIEQQAEVDNMHETRSRIESWIAEAKELAEEVEEALAAVETPAEPMAGEPANSPKSEGDWKEYASFMVYFEAREVEGQEEKRIKVSHLEEDKSKEFPGITPDHFLWMLEQADESPTLKIPESEKREAEPEPEEPRPMVEPEGKAEVNITEIRVFQPPKAKKPLASSMAGRPFQEELSTDKPFEMEVLFSLVGEDAPSVAKKEVTYRARLVAKEVETKVDVHLGDTEPEDFVEGTLDYSIRSPEVTLEPGEYSLWALITVQAVNVQPNFLEIPPIKVV